MKDLEMNKIFAAVLLAGIIAMFSGFIAELAIPDHHMEEDAIAIEGVESVAGGGGVEPMPEPILAMIAEADVAKGQKVSKVCAACHTFTKGGANGVGPNLWGVVGAKKEHTPGFAYSGALTENGSATWTYLDLNKYLWKPKKYAPGTKMNFIGLKKPEDRAAIVAYLRTLADSQTPLPTDAQIAAEQEELAPPEPEETEEVTSENGEESPAGEAAEDTPANE